ncbi:hypothetical protein CBR_g52019 [Chara braunii]|uniref:GPR1/FUN34/yaaH family protein n=1 Tax=Chara braunii TaxID=69332 RepID=A0A388M988_CHABU|nr:hypothetical protein CBR_g52019 [Chara braunii]|eukprot:GBG91138.1 hypothetical protein CBR_g52019 [Chara braunii]
MKDEVLIEEKPTLAGIEVANANPLGLTAFALTAFTMSMFTTGLLPESVSNVGLAMGYFFGGAGMLLAGLWAFFARSTFGATAYCSYGFYFLSYTYYMVEMEKDAANRDKTHVALGVFLLGWTIFTICMTIISYRTFRALFIMFVFLTLDYFFNMVGAWADSKSATKAGGWFGLMAASTALYCAMSIVVTDTWKEEVLPLGHYKA